MRCGCQMLGNAWVMCSQHYADLEAEMETEPRVIPALLNAAQKWVRDA